MNSLLESQTMRRVVESSWKYLPALEAEGEAVCLRFMNQIVEYLATRDSYHLSDAKIARNDSRSDMQKRLERSLTALFRDSCTEDASILFTKILIPADIPRDVIITIYRVYNERSAVDRERNPSRRFITEQDVQAWLSISKPQKTNGANITSSEDPFANAFEQQNALKECTVADFLVRPEYEHYRNTICIAMDTSFGWLKYLSVKKLLIGEMIEKEVARLKTAWETNRTGQPTLTTLSGLAKNPVFANQDLRIFIRDLIALNIEGVQVAAIELRSWLDKKLSEAEGRSQQTFETQSVLREWFVRNSICSEAQVDALILKVQGDGVETLDDLKFMTVDNLKACGFNTIQANKLLASFK